MSKRSEGNLFVGRLSKNTRVRDLEDIFEPYGRLTRCDIKYGAEMAYAFVDFEDRRDAEDARRHENDQELCGAKIVVEFAKGQRRRSLGEDECFRCQRPGHWASDCPDDRTYGYRKPGRSNNDSSRGRYRSPSPKRQRRRSRSYEQKSHSRSPRRDERRNRSSKSPDRQRGRNKDSSRSPDDRRSRSPSAKENNRNDRRGNKRSRRSRSSSESDE